MDADGSGTVDRVELHYMLSKLFDGTRSPPDIERLMQEADLNSDGKIQLAEFMAVYAREAAATTRTIRTIGSSANTTVTNTGGFSWNQVVTAKRAYHQGERDHLSALERLITELDGRGTECGAQKQKLRGLVEELISDYDSNDAVNRDATRKLAQSMLTDLGGTIDEVLDAETHLEGAKQKRESLTAMHEY